MKTDKPTVTVGVNLAGLARALKPLTSFAGTDDHLPQLVGVHLARVAGSKLRLSATDRTVAAVTTIDVEWENDADDLDVVMPLAMCKQVVGTWRSIVSAPGRLIVDPGTPRTLSAADSFGLAHTHPVTELLFPTSFLDVVTDRVALDDRDATTVDDRAILINFDNLVKLHKLVRGRGDDICIHWPTDPATPIWAMVGDHTIALVMPKRPPQAPPTVAAILGTT